MFCHLWSKWVELLVSIDPRGHSRWVDQRGGSVSQATNLLRAFGRFEEHWSPRIVADVNDCQVKIAKIQGEFVWHKHDTQDELFYVVRGSMVIRLRDSDVHLQEGDFYVVPRGVEHQPVAEREAWILLIEPQGTLNTGNVVNARTVTSPQRL